jgi:hypothetical protein
MTKQEWMSYIEQTWDAAQKAAWEKQQEKKPVCWYHPVSGRVRLDGKNLPPSWIPLYKE